MSSALSLRILISAFFVTLFFIPGSPLIDKAKALNCNISSIPTVTTLNIGQSININFTHSGWERGSSWAHSIRIYERGSSDGTGNSPTSMTTGVSPHGTFNPAPNDQMNAPGDEATEANTIFTATATGTIIIQGEASETDTSVDADEAIICRRNLATINIVNDTQAPDTIIDSPLNYPPNERVVTDIIFTYHALNLQTGLTERADFQCALDTNPPLPGDWSPCGNDVLGGTKPYNNLTEGSHTFYVRARDAANNIDQSPATYAFTVNLVPQAFTMSSISTDCLPSDPSKPYITVNWNPSTNAQHYIVKRADPPPDPPPDDSYFGDVSEQVYITSFTDPPPTLFLPAPISKRKYYYKVWAYRAGDLPVASSNTLNITAKTCPTPVVDIYVQQSVNGYGKNTPDGTYTLSEGDAEVRYQTAYANSCSSSSNPPPESYWDPVTPVHNTGGTLTEGPPVSLGTLTGPFGPQGYTISCYNNVDPSATVSDVVTIQVPAPTPGPWLQINGDAHSNVNIDLPIAP